MSELVDETRHQTNRDGSTSGPKRLRPSTYHVSNATDTFFMNAPISSGSLTSSSDKALRDGTLVDEFASNSEIGRETFPSNLDEPMLNHLNSMTTKRESDPSAAAVRKQSRQMANAQNKADNEQSRNTLKTPTSFEEPDIKAKEGLKSHNDSI